MKRYTLSGKSYFIFGMDRSGLRRFELSARLQRYGRIGKGWIDLSQVMFQVSDIISHQVIQCSRFTVRYDLPSYFIEIVLRLCPQCHLPRNIFHHISEVFIEKLPEFDQSMPVFAIVALCVHPIILVISLEA